jgi:signal peptidase I
MRRRPKGLHFKSKADQMDAKGAFRSGVAWAFQIVFVIVLAFAFVQLWGLRVTTVGDAMNPTLSSEDVVLVDRLWYNLFAPKRGDIVIFKPNGNEKSHYYVRRVVAVPGDNVQISDGKLYVNGEISDVLSSEETIESAGLAEEEITLAEDEFFVMGDNFNSSEDSRVANIGNIRREYIVGSAWFCIKGSNRGFLK